MVRIFVKNENFSLPILLSMVKYDCKVLAILRKISE